jgi:hypothetical protein
MGKIIGKGIRLARCIIVNWRAKKGIQLEEGTAGTTKMRMGKISHSLGKGKEFSAKWKIQPEIHGKLNRKLGKRSAGKFMRRGMALFLLC